MIRRKLIPLLIVSLFIFTQTTFAEVNMTLDFSTYFGRSNTYHTITGMVTDEDGSIYMVGNDLIIDLPPDTKTFGPVGNSNVQVVKLTNDGTEVEWVFVIGGSDYDYPRHLLLRNNELTVVGYTSSSDFPLTGLNILDRTIGRYRKGFILKLSLDGESLNYSTYFGGTGVTEIDKAIYDAQGNLYVGGTVWIEDGLPNEINAFEGDSIDAFVSMIQSDFSRTIFSRYIGGSPSYEEISSFAFDQQGNLIVGAHMYNADEEVTPNAIQQGNSGDFDIYVAKLDLTGGVLYGTYFGGSRRDFINGLCTDSSGNIFISGLTYSADFPLLNQRKSTLGGFDDTFFVKINPDGSLGFSTYVGGNDRDFNLDVVCNNDGDIVVAGYTYSADFEITNDAIQGTFSGYRDGYIQVYTANGELEYSTFWGASGEERIYDALFDQNGDLILSGATNSTDFLTTPGVVHESQIEPGELNVHGFVTKFGGVLNHGTVEFKSEDLNLTLTEGDEPVRIHVQRTGGSEGFIRIDWDWVLDNNLAPQRAITATASRSPEWHNGDTSDVYIEVSVIDDSFYKEDQVYTFTLTDIFGGAVLGQNKVATVTIKDNAPVPPGHVDFSFTEEPLWIKESEGVFPIPIIRSGNIDVELPVRVFIENISLNLADNIENFDETIVFLSGQEQYELEVPVANDEFSELDGAFDIILEYDNSGVEVRKQTSRFIYSDDPPHGLAMDSLEITLGEDAVLEIQVPVKPPYWDRMYVNWELSDGPAGVTINPLLKTHASIEFTQPGLYTFKANTGVESRWSQELLATIKVNAVPVQAVDPSITLFNPREGRFAEIRYFGATASIRIFDRNGRETIHFNPKGNSGQYNTQIWNGLDSSGRDAAPGVYHALIEDGNGKQKLKLILVR